MTIMESHHYAMELADKADRERRLGRTNEAKQYFEEAFRCESEAAMKLKDRLGIEPTRSILFRSAASLAIETGELREAEKMIAYGLTGSPPEEIVEELRDLLDRVYFERHMQLRGVSLDPNEMQLAIWGPDVGLGFARSREFRERVEKIETLSIRTLERKLDKPFRQSGGPTKEISELLGVYVSVPRAASFAVTIRLAVMQRYLPGFDIGEEVVSEMFDCLELLNNRETKLLQQRIPDENYYNNFVSITRQMAPDGKRVSHVGFTRQKYGEEKKVKLDKIRKDWEPSTKTVDLIKGEEAVEIKGCLRFADATKKRHGVIELVDMEGGTHKVKVPLGMMADIVRPMFDYEVIVKGKPDKRQRILLEDIARADDE